MRLLIIIFSAKLSKLKQLILSKIVHKIKDTKFFQKVRAPPL
ncbi:hypothetical protein [Spiroplasma melliferum]|nr:hypothetical protein [Spiroplasma melliferum]